MSLILNKCIESDDTRKVCVVSENGKKYMLNNHSERQIRRIKIDGCFPEVYGEKKCDYMLEARELSRAIFIELKGGALTDACHQLYSSITYFKAELKGFRIDARIIGSRDVPGFINTPQYKKLFREVNSAKGTIERSTNKFYSENI
jgi:hypothetical protein